MKRSFVRDLMDDGTSVSAQSHRVSFVNAVSAPMEVGSARNLGSDASSSVCRAVNTAIDAGSSSSAQLLMCRVSSDSTLQIDGSSVIPRHPQSSSVHRPEKLLIDKGSQVSLSRFPRVRCRRTVIPPKHGSSAAP